jgi:broad specificity phosphatase PhoE
MSSIASTERQHRGALPILEWEEVALRFGPLSRLRRTVFCFFRHGETFSNIRGLISGQEESDLTPAGARAAFQLRLLLPERIDRVFCSSLSRSQQTMKIAMGLRKYTPEIDFRLNEFDFGELTGKPRRFLPAFFQGDIDFRPPGGETYREFGQRVFSFLCHRVAQNDAEAKRETICVVFAHAGTMRLVDSVVGGGLSSAVQMFERNYTNLQQLQFDSRSSTLPSFWLEQPARSEQ